MPLEKRKNTLLSVPLSSVMNIQAAPDCAEKDHRLLSFRLAAVCLDTVLSYACTDLISANDKFTKLEHILQKRTVSSCTHYEIKLSWTVFTIPAGNLFL